MCSNQDVINTSQLEQSECACSTCVNMCKTAPCLGTPWDIMKLCANGFAKHIYTTKVASKEAIAYFGKPVNVYALEFKDGKCCMLDINDRCILHDKGLKPLEGKLASCKIDRPINQSPTILILDIWNRMELK